MLEPIQGESGVHVLSDELLRAAREACDAHGAALVFDEVQCGMGRTGTLWAYEQRRRRPDAITAAKALGGGLPIGALVTGARLADGSRRATTARPSPAAPWSPRAALAALEVTDDAELLAAVRERGEQLVEALGALPQSSRVRGRGLMLACELDVPRPTVASAALLRAAADRERDRADHAAAAAAADDRPRGG